jgi:hypothetical protein
MQEDVRILIYTVADSKRLQQDQYDKVDTQAQKHPISQSTLSAELELIASDLL